MPNAPEFIFLKLLCDHPCTKLRERSASVQPMNLFFDLPLQLVASGILKKEIEVLCRFGLMIRTSTVIMFGLRYVNTYECDDVT